MKTSTERLSNEWQQHPLTFDDLIIDLEIAQLFALADFFESQGMALRNRAVNIASRKVAGEQFEKRLSYLKTEIPRAVRSKIRAGMTADDACLSVSALTNVRHETVLLYWQRSIRSSSNRAKHTRNDLIGDLALQGMSNDQIAKRFEIHPNSVPRILKDIGKRRIINRPARQVCIHGLKTITTKTSLTKERGFGT